MKDSPSLTSPASSSPGGLAVGSVLRPDQQAIVDAFLRWWSDALTRPADSSRWSHIVLPPRTGKTVIAAHIAARLGVPAVFVVPTRVLLHQTRRELRRHAPGVRVGVYFGEEKAVVGRGLNLTTFATLQQHARAWNSALRGAGLIFVDEAHHALTDSRLAALRAAFSGTAVRVALTATPDRDDRRRLDTVFPHRIARQELRDAMAAGLLAPAQVEVAEVDVDGSSVELVAGEYRTDQLASLLSHAPVLHAAYKLRVRADLAQIPCMIACLSRQQADDMVRYLDARRPPGAPRAALVLGETPPAERERLLAAFEAGILDTVVQVGVLIEGWTSARCKLLIDLAPGRSRVRATQKYFRALTRDGDAVAHLMVVVPRDLRRPPVLPWDLLLEPGEVYERGRLIGPTSKTPIRVEARAHAIAGVRLLDRVVVAARLGLPRLRRHHLEDVRQVLEASPDFDPARLPALPTFEALYLQHPLFSGTGRMLLSWLGVRRRDYSDWLCALYPSQMADRILGEAPELSWEAIPLDEVAGDELADPAPGALDQLIWAESLARALRLLGQHDARTQALVRAWYGLDEPEVGTTELATRYEVSRTRISELLRGATRTIRWELYREEDAIPAGRGRDELWIQQLARGAALGDAHPLIAWARLHRRQGARGVARKVLARLFEQEPTHTWGHVEMALMALDEGRREAAVPHLEIVQESKDGAARTHLSQAYRDRGYLQEALRLVDGMPLIPPWYAADLALRIHPPAEAMAWLRRADGQTTNELRYLRVLFTHLAGQDTATPLLHALWCDPHLGPLIVQGGGAPFVDTTRDLWLRDPAILQKLEFYLRSPEIRETMGPQVPRYHSPVSWPGDPWYRACQAAQCVEARWIHRQQDRTLLQRVPLRRRGRG